MLQFSDKMSGTPVIFHNLEPGCYAMLIPGYVKDPDSLYLDILEDIGFESKNIKMFGKSIPLPRLTSYHSSINQTYKYSGIANTPKDMLPWMTKYCADFKLVSELLPKPNNDKLENNMPNSCLVNYYRNGDDYIGWHSDDEQKSYILNPIFSVSLGDARVFQLKNKETGKTTNIELGNGSLLIMYGDQLQIKYQHRVPKTKSDTGRLNLTFRYHQ